MRYSESFDLKEVDLAMMEVKSIPSVCWVGIRMEQQNADVVDLMALLRSSLSGSEYEHVAEGCWKPRQNAMTHFGCVPYYETSQTCVFGNVASYCLGEKSVMGTPDTSKQSSFPQCGFGCGVPSVHCDKILLDYDNKKIIFRRMYSGRSLPCSEAFVTAWFHTVISSFTIHRRTTAVGHM